MSKRVKYIIQEPVERQQPTAPAWLGFIAGALFGGMAGYVIGAQALQGRVVAAVPPAHEQQLQGYRNILASDPTNANAAIALANRLYDAARFGEAIPYYEQALRGVPNNIDVSTDLGTALWNVGRADDALAQFDRSLKIDARHPQTLFNIGIVRLNGKKDAAGAIAVWTRLLDANPSYAERSRVEQLIAEARRSID